MSGPAPSDGEEATRVLVVDDDEVDREIVRRLLLKPEVARPLLPGLEAGAGRGQRVAVSEADDPMVALGMIRRAAFDLVILDYHFPRHDGMVLLRELKDLGLWVPVIVLTGQDDTALAVDLMKNGAADYIPKAALNAARLGVSVRHALRLRASEHASRAVQEALRASDELNRRLLEVTHDWVSVLDTDGRLLSMSAAGRELLGVTDFEALWGTPWAERFAEGDRVAATGALAEAVAGSCGRFTAMAPRIDGAPRWWRVCVAPVVGADGKAERLVAAARDVPRP